MKLLFVHEHLGATGGAEATILLTARELQQRGHTVGLLYLRGTGRSEEAWRATFSECVQLPGRDSGTFIKGAVAKFEPDLIYLHNLPGLELSETLLESRVPVVRMVHDHGMYCMRGYKYNYFTRTPCKRPASLRCVFPCLASIGRNHDGGLPIKWVSYAAKRKEIRLNQQFQRLVVYSEYSKQELIRNGFDPRKIDICVPVSCRGEEAPVSSLSPRNLILYAGQIIRGKGVDVLLAALSKVKVPFECLILGDGNHRQHCERLCAKLGLGDRVQFRGFVPPEELESYYLEASVFTVSSLWPEPFGLVGPEAMRYGVPVVAFDAGAIGEWLVDGETGYLAPWKDTNSFAARVEQLLSDKDLARRMGRRGRERVNHEYAAARQIDRLEKMFGQVVEEAQNRANPLSNARVSAQPEHEIIGTFARGPHETLPASSGAAAGLVETPALACSVHL